MFKRLAKKIAQKHLELRFPQQPLRLMPDYGERNAADFLGEKTVQLNTGYGDLKGGPGNADEVVADELEGFEIVDDMGLDRMAEDHDRGSYMSRQNLREMSDMADFIVDDIGMEGLDDWVEDKISQSYSAMNDVARYRGYRDDYPHSEENLKFSRWNKEDIDNFALGLLADSDDEEIIDDMGIMADFDKYSRYSKGEKGQEEYAKAKRDGDVPEDFLEYEGSVTSPGETPDPSIVEKNREDLGKEARYDIIDDLEW